MKNIALLLTLFLFTIISIHAQEKKFGAELSEIRKNKNHIDLDIKNIFNGLGSATILYKRKYQTGGLIDVNAIKLIRFSGRIFSQIAFKDDPTRNPDGSTTNAAFFPSNNTSFQLGLGLEWQKMNKKFVHYYGVDGVFNFYKNDDDFSNGTIGGVTINSTTSTDRLIQSIRTGINPFFGIKYYFTKRISIGIETGISILYFTQKITEVRFEQDFVNGILETSYIEDEPVKANGIQANFNNLRFLTIGYTF